MRSKRLVAWSASCAVVAGMLVVTASPARAEAWVEPEAQQFEFVEVASPQPVGAKPGSIERARPAKVAWPQAGEADLDGLATSRSARRAGALPVSVAAPAAAKNPVDTARVRVLDQATSRRLIGSGVVVTVAAEPGAEAEVALDYSAFTNAAGGGFGNRLRWVQLPACALERPDDADCRTEIPLESTNNPVHQTVSAEVTMPGAAEEPGTGKTDDDKTAAPQAPSAGPTASPEPAEPQPTDTPESSTSERPSPSAAAEPSASPAPRAEVEQVPAELSPEVAPAAPAASPAVMVMAAVAGISGDQGNYGASSMKSSSMWQAGGSAGAFSWTYPLRTPPVAGALAPELAISYSHSSTDGAVSSTNNQASWVGEGFGLSMGFIERTFTGCGSDLPNRGTAPDGVGEQCWWSDTAKTNDSPWDNATLNLGAHSGTLVRFGNTDTWKLKDDDGTRIEKLGDPGTSSGETSEYWKVTTTDGTQYFFGKGKSDSPDTGATHSRWLVPVGANHAGEPGYTGDFSQTVYSQAWRWNLDYVVDPSGDTMTVYYAKEVNQYNKLGTTPTSYDRGGTISAIHYGERQGAEGDSPAAKVTFVTKERCDATVLADCDDDTPPTPTPTTVAAWLDVPTDAICEPSGYCPDIKNAPTFFSRQRLAEVHTWTRNTADDGYDPVDSWMLAGIFPATGDATSTPTWWLSTITHIGEGPGDAITLPAVTLQPTMMRNRIKGSGGAVYGLNRPRLWRVFDESGGRISVSYSGEDCTPDTLPADPATNTTRCFPVAYAANPGDSPVLHWFTKYVVNQVAVHDTSTATIGLPAVSGLDLSEDQVTSYSYLGGGAWRWDDSPFTPENERTWNQWRGYGKTLTIAGKTGATQTVTEQTWFRGMHGNRTATGGSAPVDVVDSTGVPTPDLDVLAGQLRETRSLKGVSGAAESRELYDVWVSDSTANNGRDQAAMIDVAKTSATQFLASGSRSTTTEVKARDVWGQPTMVEDTGDTAITGDEQCTRTSYATPADPGGPVDLIAQQSVMPALCATAENQAQVIGWSQHYYDEEPLGTVAGPGFETRTDFLTGQATRTWKTVSTASYDNHGRLTSATDALGRTSTTSYSPATLRAPRTITNTTPDPDGPVGSALPLVTTSHYDHRWGLETKTVYPAGQVTEATLDALGRVSAVWLPGRDKATQTPSEKYTYVVNQAGTGVNAVRTETLLPDGASYASQWSILDGLLRPRQIQTASVATGSQVQDFRYDSRGNPVLVDNYLITAAPASTMVTPLLRADIKRSARATYDHANRPLVEALYSGEVFQWQTTTSYDGDRVLSTPPAGGTPTTTVSDVHGRVTSLTEHLGTTTAAPGSTTTYAYDPAGQLANMVDPKGNKWSYTYDLAGNQLTAKGPDAGTTTMTYDVANRLVTTTDARGQGTRNVYDDLDRVTATKTLDGATTLTSAVYDTLKPGMVTSTSRHVTSTAQLTNRVDSYDAYGRPTQTSLVVPTVTGVIPAGLAGTYSVTTSYKPDGSVATTGLPATGPVNAEALTYGYNAKGAPTSLAGMAPIVTGTAYTQWDTVSSIGMGAVTGQAVIAMYNRDEAALRLERIRTIRQAGGSTPDEDTTYRYDPAGNVIQAKATLKSGVVDNQCFQYDFQGQLKQAFTAAASVTCSGTTTPTQATLGSGPSPYWSSWTTDTIGKTSQRVDRTATNSSTTSYTYPANGATAVRPHTVTKTVTTGSAPATRSYGYDAAGNTISRPGPTGAAQTLSYDVEGNLVAVIQGGSTIARMVYDAAGERVVRQENGKTTLTVAGTDLTIDNTSGVKTASRFYSHAGQTVAIRTGNSNADLFSVVADHQGTVHHQIRNSDSQLQTTWQNPYGDKRGTPPAAWQGQRGFVGGTNDVSTGLVRLGARDYDPVLQRFTTVDPVQGLDVPLQWNPYLYGDNSPVTKADPSGLCWWCGIGNAIAGAAKAVAGVVKATVTKAVATVKKVATAVVKKVATVAAKVVKGAVNTVKAVAKTVSTAAKTVKAVVSSTVKKVTSKVKQVASTVSKTVNHAAKAAGDAIKRAGDTLNKYGDAIQLGLDVVGLIPVVGEIADGANAIIYAAKGDYANAALSAAAMIPVGGQAATALKLGIKAGNAVAGGIAPVMRGQAGVRKVAQAIEASGGKVLGREITVKAGGVRSRPDLFVELADGRRGFVEVKNGPSARLTKNQRVAYPAISSQGFTPVGKNAADAGFDVGTNHGPMPVWLAQL